MATDRGGPAWTWPGLREKCARKSSNVPSITCSRIAGQDRLLGERMRLPVSPPVLPMLAKRVGELPKGSGWVFEPKWDGSRARFPRCI